MSKTFVVGKVNLEFTKMVANLSEFLESLNKDLILDGKLILMLPNGEELELDLGIINEVTVAEMIDEDTGIEVFVDDVKRY